VSELRDLLMRRIAAEGPMTIAEYMSVCLIHPQFGYYVTRDPLGQGGDFTTSPEISQMFGELIGLALAQFWMDLGRPTHFLLVEPGAGRGTLMADIMRATSNVPGFHAAADIWLVEASPVLRAQQADMLATYNPKWAAQFADLPDGPLFLVANEFFDALPVRQFIRRGQGWVERMIGAEGGQLVFGLGPETQYDFLGDRKDGVAEGEMVAVSLPQPAVAEEIGERIARHGGLALVFDYGEWASTGDTFQAIAKHQKVHPLAAPGQADLTAHVDFSVLAAAFEKTSLGVSFLTQREILGRWGIGQRAQALSEKLAGDALNNHISAFHRLTGAEEMGTLFKCLAAYVAGGPVPPGFEA